MVQMKWKRDAFKDVVEFSGSVSAFDIMDLNLRGCERETVNADIKTASQMLRALEVIFRRHEEKMQAKEAEDMPPIQLRDPNGQM
jgi:hypothetical protein